jgi:hypothetical protein
VALHAQLFFGFEPSLLAKDRVFDTDLADVVQDAGAADGTNLRLVATQRASHDEATGFELPAWTGSEPCVPRARGLRRHGRSWLARDRVLRAR